MIGIGVTDAFAGTPPLSSRDKLTLAICEAGRVVSLFQTTNWWESSGRSANMASYICRALVNCPVFWYKIPAPISAYISRELARKAFRKCPSAVT